METVLIVICWILMALMILFILAGIVIFSILFYLVFYDDQIATMDDQIKSHLHTTHRRFEDGKNNP